MTKMTGGEFIAETLKGYGVSTVFFVPATLASSVTVIGVRAR